MRDRPYPAGRSVTRPAVSVDVVLLTPHGRRLATLLTRAAGRSRDRWELPWGVPADDETLEDAAARVARVALGTPAAWLEQVAAFGDRRRHPGNAEFSVAFIGLVPTGTEPSASSEAAWFPTDGAPPLAPRHEAMIEGALDAVRSRLDQSPIAFRLLPPTFTLSELQGIYELLLGRRLYKASFRRALQAAWLIEPTDEWRSEGRGRPAQLFRYAPRKRRTGRRGVRFDLMSGP
jgi:8-oxo-dGTP diphosphatase